MNFKTILCLFFCLAFINPLYASPSKDYVLVDDFGVYHELEQNELIKLINILKEESDVTYVALNTDKEYMEGNIETRYDIEILVTLLNELEQVD